MSGLYQVQSIICRYCKHILNHISFNMLEAGSILPYQPYHLDTDRNEVEAARVRCRTCGAQYRVAVRVLQTPTKSAEELEKVANRNC